MSAGGNVKKGIWTEHVDPASGRTYYFNMVHGRSYWQLPEDLQQNVMRPLRSDGDETPAKEDESSTDATNQQKASTTTVDAETLEQEAMAFTARIQRVVEQQKAKQQYL
ncbi:unnamed protein product [Aphanomyces euteiches]|uniref:WW domain-containing protein n=1 Tax=Aphanomyces euteiches TaxID=100861 RepID=A0A6G0WPJ4_9STRA|nr:hypothetical protein Ae201684_013035 [Aphanomyces euteiches]KAH9076746.1 hypothetical protein Ae201684P_010680 [Aphanomyces euteiches]KAH9138197.1 hypothetical protein AeRB84_017449 [Aphanomyces euteiches]